MVNGMESGAVSASSTSISAQARLARRLIAEIRHSADLALFADSVPTRWTDALLAETRFHLAGTMNAVEMAIRLEVSEGDIEVRLASLPQPWCGPALERHVDLLTPALLAHYRLRGALSVVQRGRTDAAVSGIHDGAIGAGGEGPFSQALAALALAEQRWTGPMLFDAPLRPDLPAEIFCDLAWTVAALLISELARRPAPGDRDAMPAIVHAVERIIARHDEGGGPFALAQRCARALSSPERQRIAPLALAEHRLMLFCALVEAETALQIETVLGSLVDGDSVARQAILRLMGLDERMAVQLFEMLAPLTGDAAGQDSALMQFVEEYRQTSRDAAETWLGHMRTPAGLAAKLSIIDSVI